MSVARIQELRAQLALLQQQGSEITLLISAYGDALKKALTTVEEPEEAYDAQVQEASVDAPCSGARRAP